MGLTKKHVADRGLTWEQAVPEALCFGWIDSVSQRIDDDTRRQRWTPRKPTSIWSSVNIALVEQLTAEGRMQPAGLAAFERRRDERSGVYSHENPTPAVAARSRGPVGSRCRGIGLLACGDRDLPATGHPLGALREAGGHPRTTARPGHRRQRGGSARVLPALRRDTEVGRAGRGRGAGSGIRFAPTERLTAWPPRTRNGGPPFGGPPLHCEEVLTPRSSGRSRTGRAPRRRSRRSPGCRCSAA